MLKILTKGNFPDVWHVFHSQYTLILSRNANSASWKIALFSKTVIEKKVNFENSDICILGSNNYAYNHKYIKCLICSCVVSKITFQMFS